MTHLYEGMFLLDNQVVREDWKKAKAIITDTLEKHGAKVLAARRWDERKLAYQITKKNRATFLLTYYELGAEHIQPMRRDFELNEKVMRYLIVAREKMPEGELELAAAEQADGFVVPAPPPDDAYEPAPVLARRQEDPDELDIVVPDLENLPAEDDDSSPRPRGRRPEARSAPTEA